MTKKSILSSPDLLDRIIQVTEKNGITGNEKAKKHILLAGISTFNLNPDYTLSTIVEGPAGIGKTSLVKSVLKTFPENKIFQRSRVTKRAFDHLQDPLDNKIIFIEELTGNEGAYSTKLMISEHCLKLEATVSNDGKQETQTKNVSAIGTSFITTTTQKSLDLELESRIIRIYPERGEEYSRKVLDSIYKGVKDSTLLKGTRRENDYSEIREALESLDCYNVEIPFVEDIFNDDELISSPNGFRNLKKALGEIQAHALLYQEQRQKNGTILVAKHEDFLEINDLIQDIFSSKNVLLTRIEQEIGRERFSVKDIQKVFNVEKSRAYEIRNDLLEQGNVTEIKKGQYKIVEARTTKIFTKPLFPVSPEQVVETDCEDNNSTFSGVSGNGSQGKTTDSNDSVESVETVEKSDKKNSKNVLLEEDSTVEKWLIEI